MLLEIKNIKKSFYQKTGVFGENKSCVKAVDNVDLVINQGENIGLVGESGCGKTTLARIILRLLKSDSGSINFDGVDISQGSFGKLKHARRNMQMVFQDPYSSLDPRFNIENVMEEGFTLGKKEWNTKSKRREKIFETFSAVNLSTDILDRYPHEFSGGERQRIAIARSLVLNPKLLILDEAVSSLDVIIQKQIVELLADLRKKYDLTYLFISHNLKVVQRICQKIAVMYKGKIVELASTDDIFSYPLHPYTKELLAAAVEYRSVKDNAKIEFTDDMRLIDMGKGHFLLK
ncbi:MAG: ATP-binding cassette domain-containing protein [Candidatus Omnitrophica bacterium]|nr:ATP-binding cassette domain-containing protein [Candidatus Omnitrophota bacterium]MBU1995549.1 ATP-binding cassette domain-containing protein [Candidatus Omnitrophota bacterium]MBU4333478.1 ATP-binding cassette domain-containing protein [Candidatus Omnitrophota bacterium]